MVRPQLKIHDMRAESYNALVRLLKPGCRTLVLMLNDSSKTVSVFLLYALHNQLGITVVELLHPTVADWKYVIGGFGTLSIRTKNRISSAITQFLQRDIVKQ